MLESLNDQQVDGYRLTVEYLGQTRFFDQRDFALYLNDSHSKKSDTPIFRGRYNAGRPSIYVPTWIDGEFIETATNAKLIEAVVQKLGALILPGGRLWLAYEAFENEGELMHETRAGLLANLPLVTTPIGFLLYRADCWVGLRDWHFPEGGREGPRKLQGNKAMNAQHTRERAAESIAELENFLKQRADNQLVERAQSRAKIILPALKSKVK